MNQRDPHEPHLTNEQFADSFLGDVVPAEVQAHLDRCELCRTEWNTFAQSMDTFSGAAIVWSESQPKFSPRSVTIGSLKLAISVRGIAAHAAWVVAAALVLAVSVPAIWHREHAAVALKQVVPVSAPYDSAAQIAQDNDLMRSVNMALQANDPSPFSEYRITDLTGKGIKGRHGTKIQ